jgi:hypothetical protein
MSSHRVLYDIRNAAFLMTDPGDAGTITVDRWMAVVPLVSAAAETRTLAQPTKSGMMCKLEVKTYVGAITLTVTGGYNQAATASIVLGTAGDWVLFTSVDVGGSYYWRVVAHEGTNIVETGGGTFTTLTVTTLTGTTANTTSATHTNANATTIIASGACNAASSTVTNANCTTAIAGTANATNATIGTGNFTTTSLGNATASRLQITSSAVTAAGSVIGNAANTNYGMNIVAGADNAVGIILPVAVANGVVEVMQTVNAKQLFIYPQVNSSISGLTANVAFNTGVANTAAQAGTTQNVYFKFVATNATQWYASK